MKHIIKITVLSILITCPKWAVAANSNFTHTHKNHTPIELGLVSADSVIQYASICFLGQGDCGSGDFTKGGDDYVVDTVQQCKNEGFEVKTCALPSYVGEPCPYDEKYYKNCIEDKQRACNDSGFSNVVCGSGEIINEGCPYDASYKNCKCNPCSGYDYTLAQVSAQGYVSDGSCQSCGDAKYKRKENPCSGYQTCECGGEIGTGTCYTGNMKKFNTCKSCEPPISDCKIGAIYYSDGTCSIEKINSKLALGVVVYMKDANHGQVMTTKSIGSMAWGGYGTNIPSLPDYSSEASAATDFNSCSNTDKIVAYGNSTKYPAAHVARNYVPTTETRGKWCLPAAGIMNNIYNNHSDVQTGMVKLGGVAVANYTWSSSEYNTFGAWVLHFSGSYGLGASGNDEGFDYGSVRPVLEF